jgi:TATA-binding protein-associated factor
VTKAKIITTIRTVCRWRDVCEVYGLKSNRESAEHMVGELERLLKEVGVKGAEGKAKKGPQRTSTWIFQGRFLLLFGILELFQANAKAFEGLASEQDLSELERVYCEYFTGENAEDEPLVPTLDEPYSEMRESGGEDLGIEEESTMDPKKLALRLGFIKGDIPAQFNPHRHSLGWTPWSSPSAENANTLTTPLLLHWHQLAGVHSVIRNAFTPKPEAGSFPGTLICDEVGLGKTTLAITIIACLCQCLSSGLKGAGPPPPILSECFLR